MLKYAIVTLGCKVNQYEENQIAASFERSGFVRASDDAPPDVFVVNSCAVTSEAESKSRQAASRARNRNPGALVILTGCYATRLGEKKLDFVDLFVGQELKEKTCEVMADMLAASRELSGRFPKLFRLAGRRAASAAPGGSPGAPGRTGAARQERARAQVKIQDGCTNFCTYCVVPFIRNREWSRPPEEVIAEMDALAKAGYSEVVLTGIHLGRYESRDFAGRALRFEDLLKMIDLYDFSKKIRVRLSSIDPYDVSEKIVHIIKNSGVLLPHLHVPLQSGSDGILKAMNRKYSRSEFREKIQMIFDVLERPAVTTDVIVGFPGETREDFEETCNMLSAHPFYDFHVFQYSERPGTLAAGFSGKVPAAEKKCRSRELHDLKKIKNALFYEANIGFAAEVIPEKIVRTGKNGLALLSGHTERYIEARFEGAPRTLGEPVKVRLAGIAKDFDGMDALLQ